MKVSDANRRPPVSSVENHCEIKLETVLRIRPLLKKERDDPILLEARNAAESKDVQTVILNPLNPTSQGGGSYNRARADSDTTANNVPMKYHFNRVLPESTSQDKLYYTIGLPIVTTTMNSIKNATSRHTRDRMPKSHLLISMGVENSGKTYSCFGGMTIPKRRASQDGLVPRLLDSMFSQSNHAGGSSKGFTIQISIVQVTQPKAGGNSDQNSCRIHDLLATPQTSSSSKTSTQMFGASPKKKKNLTVRNMAARFERVIPSPVNRRTQNKASEDKIIELDAENLKPSFQNCRDITHAREILQNAFNTSQKHRTGDQNYHLYITMQPAIDGTKSGDSISVLDMAGLKKEQSEQSIRGKQSVVGTNQAANEAVFHCLKAMMHNVNVSSYLDDQISEISLVSQAKNHTTRDQLKPVPFRRHKVTMILNQLFLQNSTVQVTLLLTAYPGHIDLQQKRMLLQDIEMLHGSKLAMSLKSCEEEYTSSPPRSRTVNNSNKNIQKTNNKQKITVKLATSFEQGHESKIRPRVSNDRQQLRNQSEQNAKIRSPMTAQRIRKVEPIRRNSRSIGSPVRPSPMRPSAPIMITQEHRASLESFKFVEQTVASSDPTLREIQQPYNNPMKGNKSFVSDFPGVQDSARNEVESGFPDSSATRRISRERPIATIGNENDSGNFFDEKECSSFQNKAETRNDSQANQQNKLRSPLGRSRLENSEHAPSNITKPARNDFCKNEDGQQLYNEHEKPHASNYFDDAFASQANDFRDSKTERNKDHNETKDRVKVLEGKLKQSVQEKQALERICSQLEQENAELKNSVREAGRKSRQSRWTEQDEKEFLDSRRMRHEAQNIIKEPIIQHLEKVKYIYGIKNQWCMTNKRHFSLSFPSQFERAPALDIRDSNMLLQEDKDVDDKKVKTDSNDNAAKSKRKGLTSSIRKSFRASPRGKSPMFEPPTGLSALKKLAAKRLQY